MDFTRQPIIETIITPKEGCKLVVRSSKTVGQEEYFVDSLEVVAFGNALFFRSTERPKSFLVPVSDYEVLEARETRVILKNVGIDRTIKIGNGRESAQQKVKEAAPTAPATPTPTATPETPEAKSTDKRREKRRSRRRRGREEETTETPVEEAPEKAPVTKAESNENGSVRPESNQGGLGYTPSPFLAPPPTLISDTIARYKNDALFKGAFYVKELEPSEENSKPLETAEANTHPEDIVEALEMEKLSLEPSDYGFLGFMEGEGLEDWVPPFAEETKEEES